MRLSYPYALCLTILILEQNPFHPRFELFKNFLHFPFISYHFFFECSQPPGKNRSIFAMTNSNGLSVNSSFYPLVPIHSTSAFLFCSVQVSRDLTFKKRHRSPLDVSIPLKVCILFCLWSVCLRLRRLTFAVSSALFIISSSFTVFCQASQNLTSNNTGHLGGSTTRPRKRVLAGTGNLLYRRDHGLRRIIKNHEEVSKSWPNFN